MDITKGAIRTGAVRYLLEHSFDGLAVKDIKILGSGYDSIAYLVNNEYVFKVKYSANEKKSYKKEKAICDFLNKNLTFGVEIPSIEYFCSNADVSILGYKMIKGNIFSPSVYERMSKGEQDMLKQDIADFLRQMHSLDTSEIKSFTIDNKQNVLDEYRLLKNTIYDELSNLEKAYIEDFMQELNKTRIFDGKKCLCHNDFSCNHLLLNENNKLCGVIDFGDSGIIDEYCDFVYLLEDSEEEIGPSFGEEIIRLCGGVDVEGAKKYRDVVERYYPIETVVYGVRNNNAEFICKGRKEMEKRVRNDSFDDSGV